MLLNVIQSIYMAQGHLFAKSVRLQGNSKSEWACLHFEASVPPGYVLQMLGSGPLDLQVQAPCNRWHENLPMCTYRSIHQTST